MENFELNLSIIDLLCIQADSQEGCKTFFGYYLHLSNLYYKIVVEVLIFYDFSAMVLFSVLHSQFRRDNILINISDY